MKRDLMRCAYGDQDGTAGGVKCNGPVVFTVHDKRGCRNVCFAHAKWLMTHSLMFGHGLSCPGPPRPAQRMPVRK